MQVESSTISSPVINLSRPESKAYPPEWYGQFLVCHQHGTHGPQNVWEHRGFPLPYSTRGAAERAIQDAGKPWLSVCQIFTRNDNSYPLQHTVN